MINDNDIKKSKQEVSESLELTSKEIYDKYLKNKKRNFKLHYKLVLSSILSMLVILTLSLALIKNLNEKENEEINEPNINDNVQNDEEHDTEGPDINIEDPDEELSEEQKLRKTKYNSGNKNFYYERVRQNASALSIEEKDIEQYISSQDLSNVNYYYEVKVDYQTTTMKNQTIIVKKGELFYPSTVTDDNRYMYKNGYIFDGWVIDEDITNIVDEAVAIESDCTFRASWCKKESYTSDLFSCSYYIKENKQAVISSGKLLNESKNITELVFPDMINGYKIVEIRKVAFSQSKSALNGIVTDPGNENFKTLVLPKYLEKLGTFAFGRFAALEEVYIGGYLSYIEGGAFYECLKIKSFNIDENNKELVYKDNCLYNKVTQELILSCNSKILPNNIKTIKEYAYFENKLISSLNLQGVEIIEPRAFSGCSNLVNIENFDDLEYIGSYAFINCSSLVSFDILNNVSYIGVNPFSYCSNVKFNVQNDDFELVDDCIIDLNSSTIIIAMGKMVADVNIIGKAAFQGNSNIEEVNMPASITLIEDYAFENAKNLKKVVMHNDLKSIGYSSFKGCASLVDLVLPESIDYLGNIAFSECTSLKEIKLPEGLEVIPNGICQGCKSLEIVYLPSTAKIVDNLAFGYCSNLKYVDGFNQIVEFRNNSFTHTSLVEFNFSSERVTIGWGAFRCSKAKVIYIPGNVTSIGVVAFANSDKSLILLEKSINNYSLGDMWADSSAVYDNIDINNVYYTDEYLAIKNGSGYMLSNYFGEEEIVYIPSTINDIPVISIAGTLFKGNQMIKEVILGENIIEIGQDAFRDSTLQKIVFNEKLEKIGEAAFLNTHLEEVIMPDSVVEVEFGAFQQNNYLKKIIVSNNLSIVPSQMVWMCPLLEYVYLGDSVTEIGEYAVWHCPNLKFLRVGPNLKEYYRIYIFHYIEAPSVALVLGNVREGENGRCDSAMKDVKIYFEETLDMTVFSDDYLYTLNNDEITYYLYDEWEYVNGYPVLKEND